MTKYATGNPAGSADPRDLYDTAEVSDNLFHGPLRAYRDRLGKNRKSWTGIEKDFAEFLASSGYQFLGDYAAGIEVTAYNQVIRDAGEMWSPAASTTLPYTTTGLGMDESGAFVSRGDAVLRQELAESPSIAGKGVRLVAGAVHGVASRAEMKACDVPPGTQISLEESGRSGVGVVKSGTPPSDPYEAIYIVLDNGNYWERNEKSVVKQSWFGIVDDPTIAIDQTARVQSFWDMAATQSIGVAWDTTIGISDKLNTPENLKLLCKNVTLKVRPDFTGGTGFREAVSSENVKNVQVESLFLDGNESALGGLIPVFTGDPVRGFAVVGGCENITYRYCRADNVQANGFIHFSGGAYEQSKNVIFDNCVSANSGVPFGQEIVQGTVVTPDGPGYTEYKNCRSELGNYGLYIAGGEFKVIGGNYHAKRVRALVVYTGDAHAVTKGDIESATFRMTPEVGANDCAEIKCINEQPTAPNYQKQQDLSVTLSGVCKFIQDEPSGINLRIKEGSNVSGVKPLFVGGASCVRTEKSGLAGGPYRPGKIVFHEPDLTEFQTDGLRADMEITFENPVFRSPATTSAVGAVLTAGGIIRMSRPTFGAVTDANVLDKGLSTSVSGTEAIITGAQPVNVTTLFSVTLANSANWQIEKTEGGSVYDRNILYGSGSPEGVVAAPIGRIYIDVDGGAGTTQYVKESSPLGNTGWVAK